MESEHHDMLAMGTKLKFELQPHIMSFKVDPIDICPHIESLSAGASPFSLTKLELGKH